MVTYGLTIENEKLIVEKAKAKSDGCYRFRGVAYRVLGGNVTHYAHRGTFYERCYGFNVNVGSYTYSMNSAEIGQELLKRNFK